MNGRSAGDGTRPAFPYYYWNESQSYKIFIRSLLIYIRILQLTDVFTMLQKI